MESEGGLTDPNLTIMKTLTLFIVSILLFSNTVFPQVGINSNNSAPDPSAGLDVNFTNKGLLPPRMTFAERDAISNPAIGLVVICTNCKADGTGCICMYLGGQWLNLAGSCDLPATPSIGIQGQSNTQITWNWNAVPIATGYKWNTTNDYTTALNMGTATTKTETGLTFGNSYTRYVWAYNACGYSAAPTVLTAQALNCGNSFTVNHVAGNVAPVSKTVNYGTVNNIPGEPSKCWLYRNLGATQKPSTVDDNTEAAAGWYWQFNQMQGYKHDGTTRTPASTWITTISENSEWTSNHDPCSLLLGSAWRLPTSTEWSNLDAAGNWTNWNGPWNSGLILHAAGHLSNLDGSLISRGLGGFYCSSSQFDDNAGMSTFFSNIFCYQTFIIKTIGLSARCVRD
jgi:hypothetical protein